MVIMMINGMTRFYSINYPIIVSAGRSSKHCQATELATHLNAAWRQFAVELGIHPLQAEGRYDIKKEPTLL